MTNMKEELGKIFKGEISSAKKDIDTYSKDASLLKITPSLIGFPKDSEDIAAAVKYAADNKKKDPNLSVTVRAAGTCMSGGPLNESIILDVTKHMTGVLGISGNIATALPGTYYRDFEKETLKKNLVFPVYPASKDLCAIGGMVGNNCAGEKTLTYGKIEDFVDSLKVIFSDGKEYEVKPLSKKELDKKVSQGDFEGEIYRKIFDMVSSNKKMLKEAKPKVSKNSAGYYLWNVWDEEKQIFDLTKLIVGSQGTLGIVTEARLRLVQVKKASKLYVIFLKDTKNLAELVNAILPHNPETLESYDDATMKLAIRFFPEMLQRMKVKNFFKMIFSFIPEGWMILTGGIPKLILLVEFTGENEEAIDIEMERLEKSLEKYHLNARRTKSMEESEKYWTIRRESFSLLRKHVSGKRTAPFVDDVCVKPEYLPEFLPKMREILDSYDLLYTIAGHAGNGNFHIIPLMDMRDEKNVDVIMEVSEKVYDLTKKYHGSITAEHNDGIIRTPYLDKMFAPEVLRLFKETKNIFDPQNILNPHKKVDCTLEYMRDHIVREV